MKVCYIYDIVRELTLTNIWNVERKPVQESVADQFGKEQTQRELHHSLCETQNTMKSTDGPFIISTCSYCYGAAIHNEFSEGQGYIAIVLNVCFFPLKITAMLNKFLLILAISRNSCLWVRCVKNRIRIWRIWRSLQSQCHNVIPDTTTRKCQCQRF